ncbi:MAG: hypothetical protein IMHGJWDQ_002109 [Candidatus Fervidibacter sp.]
MRRKGRMAIGVLVLVVLLGVIGAIGFVAVQNSPQRVAQAWAEALARKDQAALKKLVLPKDEGRVPQLLGFTNYLPDMSVQLAGVDDRQDHKVARVAVKFSQVTLGRVSLKLSGSAELPFVLVRERLIFWRVDLERSESLLREATRKAILDAIRQNPQLQQLLQFLPRQ